MKTYKLFPSTAKGKKWTIITPEGKTIHFGSTGSDYTIHKDPKRKNSYIQRHAPREDWSDLSSAGAWARALLWNQPSLEASIKDTEKRFGIRIL